MENFADRLLEAIARKRSPVCVGIDPNFDYLPDELRRDSDASGRLQTIRSFCEDVLRIVEPYAPAVKPQSAYFEAYGPPGVEAYYDVVRRARELGLIVIGDVKRQDIGSTASAYAAGHLADPKAPDAVTVGGYFGTDGIAPFIDAARETGRGLFVLVRTSNPSATQVQDITDVDGKALYEHMAELVAMLGGEDGLVGSRGYSAVGAVVGATYPDEARKLRKLMPQQIFLVPGYGAQGATAAECKAAFAQDGTGAIVNASRSVIYAHRRERYAELPWRQAVESAAKDFARDIRNAIETQR
ncbi:MAG: orotidine-5'-phosphate decarboxylase [Phycisphaerae bacterium]